MSVTVGDSITLLESVIPWYSGYGCNPSVVAEAGTVGMVAAVDVPCVTRPKGTPATYFTAALDIGGTFWTAHFFARDRGKTWAMSGAVA